MKINQDIQELLIKLVHYYNPECDIKDYFRLIESLESKEGPNTQVHHIIPRCLFDHRAPESLRELIDENYLNSWDSGNLIRVSIENHIECHRVLWSLTRIDRLAHALGFVLHYNQNYLNSEDKKEFSKELHDVRSELFKKNVLNPESIAKRNITHEIKYGTVNGACLTPESKAKARQTKITKYGKYQPNPWSREAIDKSHEPEAVEKRKRTIEERYGHQKPWQTSEALAKASKSRRDTILERYSSYNSWLRGVKRKSPDKRSFYKVDLSGNILKRYVTKSSAMTEEGLSSHLGRVLKSRTIYRDHYWIFEDEYESWKSSLN